MKWLDDYRLPPMRLVIFLTILPFIVLQLSFESPMKGTHQSTYIPMKNIPLQQRGSTLNIRQLFIGSFIFGFLVISSAKTADSDIRIAKFSGDKSAAISYTFDDGLRDQYIVGVPMLDEFGFKGTFFIIPSVVSTNIEDAESRKNHKRAWGTITWAELREMASKGHEIANHTWSHRGLTKLDKEEITAELTRAIESITQNIGRSPLTIAFPFNQSTPEIRAAALEKHVAYRGSQLGVGGNTSLESLNDWTEKQIRDGTWGVIMVHGISHGYAAFNDPEVLRGHLCYVKNRETDIWVDTFGNIARYERERENAKLTLLSSGGNRISCELTSDLTPDVFNFPLTLVIDISGAKSARAEQAGIELPVRTTNHSIQIDVAPSPHPISLTWR